MFDFFTQIFSSDFMPHGHCYLWRPDVLWLNVGSDFLIGASYLSIPMTLLYFVRRREDLVFNKIFVLFAAFILLCGATHFMNIWTVWHGTYRLEGALKLVTALVSAATAVSLWRLIPKALSLPSLAVLESEVEQRIRAEEALREMNEALLKRADALAALDQAKTEFFSNISHEFRTPLTLILGPLEQLLEMAERKHEDVTELNVMRQNALRLLKLVNDLLDFSALHAQRMRAQFVPTDLAELTADLASLFRSAAQAVGLEFTVKCEKLSQPVYVDRPMWEKAVINLLSNALKYTNDGSIELTLSEEDGRAVLRIRDSGIGIPPQEITKIFERFHRVDSPESRATEGSGIGLSLVDEIVKLHGGNVTVGSEVGKGSTFQVSLCFGSDHLSKDQIYKTAVVSKASRQAHSYVQGAIGEARPESSDAIIHTARVSHFANGAATNGVIEPATKPLILIVDDNPDIRDYLQSVLGVHYETTVAVNGKQALSSLEERRPDIILSDVMMPEMDGLTFVSKVRVDKNFSDIPIVLLSARAGEDAAAEARSFGADDYLEKPFTARALLARVDANLQLARQRASAFEHSKALLAAIVQSSTDAIMAISPEGKIESWNTGAIDVFGYGERTIVSHPVSTVIDPKDLPRFETMVGEIQGGGVARVFEATGVAADGTTRELSVALSPIGGRNGSPRQIAMIARDVTERKLQEMIIRESLKEKDLMLKEIHHRVKNNMQVVSSLLRLQASRLEAGRAKDILRESERRVRAMVLIHERLYRSDGLASIPFGDYLKELVNELIRTYEIEHTHVTVETFIEPTTLGVDQAIPCGLLVNEVVSNALKHAFTETTEGRLIVELHSVGNSQGIRLSISDNGKGLPDDFEIGKRRKQSLGFEIIRTLSEQLSGELQIIRGQGTTVTLTFAKDVDETKMEQASL